MIRTKKNQSEITASFFTVWKKMSDALKEDLAKQVTGNVRQYGHNLRVTIPASTSDEMHRLSNNLVVTGAISRTKGHMDSNGIRPDRDFTFVVHHEMADALIKQCKEVTAFVFGESSSRLRRSHKGLHFMLWGALPQSTGKAVIHIADAVSVAKMEVTAHVDHDGVREEVDGYVLDRTALNIIRGIIAPFNHPHAEVTISFEMNDPASMTLETNGMILSL